MSKGVDIPPKFWEGVSPVDAANIFITGRISGMQMIRLWKMLGRTDKCPAEMEVMVEREGLERAIKDAVRKFKK